MNKPVLYRGLWPQNVSKLAKYSIRLIEGIWKITVLYEAGEGLRYLAVEGGSADLIHRINNVKTTLRQQQGGAFYVNEFRHVIVPVSVEAEKSVVGSHYYFAGLLESDLSFTFEGVSLSTKPIKPDGTPLLPGDRWVGPRPGIPYVLAAGGGDIYFTTPALTDDNPPQVRPMMTRKVQLSKILKNNSDVERAVRPVTNIRGHLGGRFYVNEHGAMFTPVSADDGNGLDYIYCGQIDRNAWFPEPKVGE